jgi:hypothetical protein
MTCLFAPACTGITANERNEDKARGTPA